jgi:folate-binding protein YgfZ
VSVSLIRADEAVRVDIAGHDVVLHHGDPASEYAALRIGAIVVDQSHRHRMSVRGPRAAEMVTGLVTNDVKSLTPGRGQYAAALTPKGKIVADLRIFARHGDELWIDTGPRSAPGWSTIMTKYVNPRLAPHTDITATTSDLSVVGVRAADIVASAIGFDRSALESLDPYAHLPLGANGEGGLVARIPDVGLDAFALIVPRDQSPSWWRRLVDARAKPSGVAVWDIARIEAGRPEWGIDMDDTTLPQEANLEELQAISYTKGCYTGQETVARVHFRGHVNRHLRSLRFVAREAPPPGAELVAESGKPAGQVRSAALSPRLGGVALAMVRREVPLGATVTVKWEGGDCQAGVTAPPLPL